ncbi:hypothetical protein CHUAL_011496 [Chamberlinius hualienensis]
MAEETNNKFPNYWQKKLLDEHQTKCKHDMMNIGQICTKEIQKFHGFCKALPIIDSIKITQQRSIKPVPRLNESANDPGPINVKDMLLPSVQLPNTHTTNAQLLQNAMLCGRETRISILTNVIEQPLSCHNHVPHQNSEGLNKGVAVASLSSEPTSLARNVNSEAVVLPRSENIAYQTQFNSNDTSSDAQARFLPDSIDFFVPKKYGNSVVRCPVSKVSYSDEMLQTHHLDFVNTIAHTFVANENVLQLKKADIVNSMEQDNVNVLVDRDYSVSVGIARRFESFFNVFNILKPFEPVSTELKPYLDLVFSDKYIVAVRIHNVDVYTFSNFFYCRLIRLSRTRETLLSMRLPLVIVENGKEINSAHLSNIRRYLDGAVIELAEIKRMYFTFECLHSSKQSDAENSALLAHCSEKSKLADSRNSGPESSAMENRAPILQSVSTISQMPIRKEFSLTEFYPAASTVEETSDVFSIRASNYLLDCVPQNDINNGDEINFQRSDLPLTELENTVVANNYAGVGRNSVLRTYSRKSKTASHTEGITVTVLFCNCAGLRNDYLAGLRNELTPTSLEFYINRDPKILQTKLLLADIRKHPVVQNDYKNRLRRREIQTFLPSFTKSTPSPLKPILKTPQRSPLKYILKIEREEFRNQSSMQIIRKVTFDDTSKKEQN